MTHNFKYPCRRRPVTGRASSAKCVSVIGPLGAGSGGGPEDGSTGAHYDGTYAIAANRVEIATRPPLPPATPTDFVISMMAGGMGTDGRIEGHGSQGVRFTAGLPEMPPASSSSTNGAEIIVGDTQNITLQRGLIPDVDQLITMKPGSIMVDGGEGTVTVQSLTSITLSVAGGATSIKLTPEGVTIQGLLIRVQGEASVQVEAPMVMIN